jgi:hypothetical protein
MKMRATLSTKNGVLLLLLGVMVLTAGCFGDPLVHIEGRVIVPVEVQGRFSSSNRGKLSVLGGGTIFILCDPDQTDLIVPYISVRVRCAVEGYIEAYIDPLSKDYYHIPCGMGETRTAGNLREFTIASGRQLVFKGKKDGTWCGGGTDTAPDITVALVPGK